MEPGTGDDAVGFGVEADADDDVMADAEWAVLFAEGEEEVFGEAPVEEGAGFGVDTDDAEGGVLADFGDGVFGGGDEAVFGVAVDEDVDGGVFGKVYGDIATGEEDFTGG